MTQPLELLPNLYAFNVPRLAFNIEVYGTIHRPGIMYNTPKDSGVISREISPGNWSIICCSLTASEEDAAKVVERDFFDEDWEDKKGYIHYEDGRLICDSTIDSLRSLLRSKNCDPSLNWLILKLEQ